ncbi:MAG: peptidyl-prolyl cis-trans isomerase [Fibrobacterota bacterium]
MNRRLDRAPTEDRMTQFLTLVLITCTALFFTQCGPRRGPLVAKIKGLKIYQSELDTLFPDLKDKERRTEKLRELIQRRIDEQALYDEAVRRGYSRLPEERAVLKNILMIESATYYEEEILKKNWGFSEKRVQQAYRDNRETFKKPKPVQDPNPTPAQKAASAAWEKDPYLPLDLARTKVLRKLLLAQPENKKTMDEFIKGQQGKADSAQQLITEDKIVNEHLQGLDAAVLDSLKKARTVKTFAYVPAITEDELKAEWEKTKSFYKRQPDLQVLHIEVADAKKGNEIQDLCNNKGKDFLALQKKFSLDKNTKGKTLTLTDRDEIKGLPGETRSVYPRVQYLDSGKVSNPIGLKYSAEKETFHLFKVVAKEPEAIMAYDEAKDKVRKSVYDSKQLNIPPATVVLKVEGRDITIGDVNSLLFKMAPSVMQRYRTEEGRTLLIEKYYLRFLLLGDLAKSLGLTREPKLLERITGTQRNFLVSDFRQTEFDLFYDLTESQLRGYYKDHPDLFLAPDKKTVQPFESVKGDVVSRILVNDAMVTEYYNFNMEEFADNNGNFKPLADVRPSVYFTLLGKVRKARGDEAIRNLRKKFGARIYNKDYAYADPEANPDTLFEATKKFHEERKYSDAIRNYQELRFRFPAYKAHPDICMALAQIYIEQNQYPKALSEYRRFLRLYTDHKDRYKAQFMIGFVYSEHLKDKDKSVTAYQSVLDNYPSCDLVESAKFMIEHLKSGKDDFFFSDSTTPATH